MWIAGQNWIPLIAFVGAALNIYYEPSHCVRGWLWQEAFYEGRPTSRWREIVIHDVGTPPTNWWVDIRCRIGFDERRNASIELVRSRQADKVLKELTQDQNKNVVRFARRFLELHDAGMNVEDNFSCRVEWQFFMFKERLNAHKRFE